MRNFLEHTEAKVQILTERILDEKGNKEIDIKAKWQQADRININKRRYRKEILQREIKKINEKIAKGESIWGCAFHPADNEGFGKPSDISHKWNRVWMESDGSCLGELTLLNTQVGRDLQVLVKHGKIGISSRGRGNVTEKEEIIDGKSTRFLDVNDDYILITPGDFVNAPSVRDAGAGASEALKNLEHQLDEADGFANKEDKNMALKFDESIIEKLTAMNYSRDVERGTFSGSLKEYKKKNLKLMKASYLVGSNQFSTIPEALRAMDESLEALKFEANPEMSRVTPQDVWAEARVMGEDPKIVAQRINEKIDSMERTQNDTRFTSETLRFLMKEAIASGIDPHSKQFAQFLESAKKEMMAEKRDLTLDEIVERRVKILAKQGISTTKEFAKKVLLWEREQEEKEKERLKKVQNKQRLVAEATQAGASDKDIRKIIGE